jgi:MATE family multidrug resistance protein
VITSAPTPSVALKQLLKFSLPIILGQVGLMLIGTGDMIIAGRYSRECLAAIGLAIAIANPIQISLLGLQFSISPLLAQKRGSGETIAPYFWTVILYSLLISVVSCALTYWSANLVIHLNYGDNLNPIIERYLIVTSFSSFGLCLYQGMKEFFQSQEKTLSANSVALVGVGVNLLFNYAFVFGKLGMPELKEEGLAWASLGVRMFMGCILFFTGYKWFKSVRKIDWSFMKEMWMLGGPIAISLFFEIMAFCSVTLFIGKLAEVQTAANNLALNIGSLAFMIPLSISAAVSVKVGHAYGERNFKSLLVFSQVSLFASFIFTLCMGTVFYLFPHAIMSLFTDDVLVLDWAKKLLFWVACFQLFDGAQITISGILRGLSITRAPSLAIFFGYWIIGIPLGYYLGFYTGLEAQGFWIGLAVSLAVVAIILGYILRSKLETLKQDLLEVT